MDYRPILIKDMSPHKKKGDKFGPVNEKGYRELIEDGWVNDEDNIIKTKSKKAKKSKKDEQENNDINN
jgi:hypothetical protein|tara:strand:- start:7042 stop:7245 length:204 start_codon:yes stop_codon:yes gene_type:complete